MIWVGQLTEETKETGKTTVAYFELRELFPEYDFSIMRGPNGSYVIGKPDASTVQRQEDNTTERDMLLHIVSQLVDEHIGCRSFSAAVEYIVESHEMGGNAEAFTEGLKKLIDEHSYDGSTRGY